MAGPFSIFSRMGSGSQSGKLIFKSISTSNIDVDQLNNALILSNYYLYEDILFVDPRGNDSTAVVGYVDKPWAKVKSASDYIENNNLLNKIVYILSGTYSESRMTSTIDKGYHLVSGARILQANSAFPLFIINNCNIAITSDSKFDCSIGTTSGTYIINLSSASKTASCIIENTNLITGTVGFLITGSSFESTMDIRNSIIDANITSATLSTNPVFNQTGYSTLSLHNSKIYSNLPNRPISLIKSTSTSNRCLLNLSNSYVYVKGGGFKSIVETSATIRNDIFIDNCVFQVATSFTASVIYSDSGSTQSNYIITLGNSMYNTDSFSTGSTYLTFSDSNFLNKSVYQSDIAFGNTSDVWAQFFNI